MSKSATLSSYAQRHTDERDEQTDREIEPHEHRKRKPDKGRKHEQHPYDNQHAFARHAASISGGDDDHEFAPYLVLVVGELVRHHLSTSLHHRLMDLGELAQYRDPALLRKHFRKRGERFLDAVR